MPRPKRSRQICQYPDYWSFAPLSDAKEEVVELTLDELETIRLIDYGSLSQVDCAEQMGVSRTTVTAMYDRARKKIADSIIGGKRLEVKGGNCEIKESSVYKLCNKKGKNIMRIAIPYENGEIFQHFEHAEQFKVYDIGNGAINNSTIIETQGEGHGAIAGFLQTNEVDVLICGGIGDGAVRALLTADIDIYAGAMGLADDFAKAFAEGRLVSASEPTCNCGGHHDHGHSHEGSCGHDHGHSHGCGCHGDDGGCCH
ncbi:Predicted DNA-binding protein, UPF0251 family [Peptoniphilus asaccharolyticus DSM 20463]|uniref:Predicted DNA-binding protein, UPF0251 family n=1 Tax=Peptoniphilus asaccharolyticus DSM 20463 TaxID=573058 RepID=A0A1W1V1T3_PEPAS|nr:DUF134 domain-containing protein [Peptoniphilus asaccharolyticus]MBL7576038.1 DUF134 domain-containing protein [Peptoniphilus asaccharolyticus]SMB87337.1 Predicted DNA-binding protein, UPF0251 family [Peptoniphilus asaccharolyticus DSM 20463]